MSHPPEGIEGSLHTTANVRQPSYRWENLLATGIQIRTAHTELPDHVSRHVDGLRARERESPGPSPEETKEHVAAVNTLAEGCTEAELENFLKHAVFPKTSDRTYGRQAGLFSTESSLMLSHFVPNNPESPFRISQPKPDLLYGYSVHLEDKAFTRDQLLAHNHLPPRDRLVAAVTTNGLTFPFLAIEIKSTGGTRGDLWVGTNQCAGASSACLEAVDRLNSLLKQQGSVHRIDNVVYSIAMDNNVAKLHVSWKEDDSPHYLLQRVGAFLLLDPEHFKSFRNQVRCILDWGKDTRLHQIRDALDIIMEENRKAAGSGKTREPPETRESPNEGRITRSSKRLKP